MKYFKKKPDISNVFKNSVGYNIVFASSIIESCDKNSLAFPF
jgi:hypothetical protein